EPEQPPARRTEESCASASHFESGANPYVFATLALGKLSYVHIPSSARAAMGSATARHRAAVRCMLAPPRGTATAGDAGGASARIGAGRQAQQRPRRTARAQPIHAGMAAAVRCL